jgi:hypothetical protein
MIPPQFAEFMPGEEILQASGRSVPGRFPPNQRQRIYAIDVLKVLLNAGMPIVLGSCKAHK